MRRKTKESISPWLILGTVVAVIVFCFFIGILIFLQASEPKFDKATGCRIENNVQQARSQLVILIDVTDRLQEDVAGRLRDRILTIIENGKKDGTLEGTLIELYALDGRVSNYKQDFRSCVPKNPNDANKFTENAEMLRHNFNKRFMQKLNGTVDRLIQMQSESNRSPIFEMIKAVAQKSFSSNQIRVNGERRLIVVSDFMHNMPGKFSMYNNKKAYDFATFRRSAYGSGLLADSSYGNLQGVQVELWYTRPMIFGSAKFWEKYFNACYAEVVLSEPI